jgi:hypothetical protein
MRISDSKVEENLDWIMHEASHVGAVVAGIGHLKDRCENVILVGGDFDVHEIKATHLIGISFDGLTFDGNQWFRFSDMRSWDDDRGEPGVCWTNGGVKALVVPSRAPDPTKVRATVVDFVEAWDPETQHVYLSSIGSSHGDRSDSVMIDGDALVVNGEPMLLEDIVWASVHGDGDGNVFCHVVTNPLGGKGVYRVIGLGDLSR